MAVKRTSLWIDLAPGGVGNDFQNQTTILDSHPTFLTLVICCGDKGHLGYRCIVKLPSDLELDLGARLVKSLLNVPAWTHLKSVYVKPGSMTIGSNRRGHITREFELPLLSPHGDVLLKAGAEASAGHFADDLSVGGEDLAVLTGRGPCRDESHAAPGDALGQLLLYHLVYRAGATAECGVNSFIASEGDRGGRRLLQSDVCSSHFRATNGFRYHPE